MLPVRFSLSITVPALMLFVAVAIAIGRSLLIISSTIRFKKINYSYLYYYTKDGERRPGTTTTKDTTSTYIYICVCMCILLYSRSKFAYQLDSSGMHTVYAQNTSVLASIINITYQLIHSCTGAQDISYQRVALIPTVQCSYSRVEYQLEYVCVICHRVPVACASSR